MENFNGQSSEVKGQPPSSSSPKKPRKWTKTPLSRNQSIAIFAILVPVALYIHANWDSFIAPFDEVIIKKTVTHKNEPIASVLVILENLITGQKGYVSYTNKCGVATFTHVKKGVYSSSFNCNDSLYTDTINALYTTVNEVRDIQFKNERTQLADSVTTTHLLKRPLKIGGTLTSRYKWPNIKMQNRSKNSESREGTATSLISNDKNILTSRVNSHATENYEPEISFYYYNYGIYKEYDSKSGGVLFLTDCQSCNWSIRFGENSDKFESGVLFVTENPHSVPENSLFKEITSGQRYNFRIRDQTGRIYKPLQISVRPGETIIVKITKKQQPNSDYKVDTAVVD